MSAEEQPALAPTFNSRNLVVELKKVVVNIEKKVSYGLNHDKVGSFVGTGFIVDKERGLIVTNLHVSGVSPQQVHITFENGEKSSANLLHTDPWHDFAFYRLQMKEIDWPLCEARLGKSFNLKEQEEVFLIGNNDSEEYSIKFGAVTNLTINRGVRHSYGFQTSFDRTGGSSGSPVFDTSGTVVGIHMRGSDTTSIELRIEYIADALEQLQRPVDSGEVSKRLHKVTRGDVGIELELYKVSDAIKHFGFPQHLVNELKEVFPDIKHLLALERTVPLGKAAGIIRPGDIIYRLNGILLGKNLYLFDKIIDENAGKEVEIELYRNGTRMMIKVMVEDASSSKVTQFALFAGGVFHELNPTIRSRFSITEPGVFLSQVSKGSCLSDLGEGTSKSPTSFVTCVEEICGFPTHTLAQFIDAISKIGSRKHIYVISRNLRSFSSALVATAITLDLKFEPLRVFEWSSDELEWIEKKFIPVEDVSQESSSDNQGLQKCTEAE